MEMIRLIVPLLLAICGAMAGPFPIPEDIIFDLTQDFDENTITYPTYEEFKMEVTFNGTAPKGFWLQLEKYKSGTGAGTHVDAPCLTVTGKSTIDQIPLNHLVAPAAVIDISIRSMMNKDAMVKVDDLKMWEDINEDKLDNKIVLVKTGWSEKWSDPEAYTGSANMDVDKFRFPGMSSEAAKWLVSEREVFGVGIDTLSLEGGKNLKDGATAHEILLGANMYIIENLANLDKLPSKGAKVVVLPMKIKDACAAPLRIIAVNR